MPWVLVCVSCASVCVLSVSVSQVCVASVGESQFVCVSQVSVCIPSCVCVCPRYHVPIVTVCLECRWVSSLNTWLLSALVHLKVVTSHGPLSGTRLPTGGAVKVIGRGR